MVNIKEVIEFYLPYICVAGEYAINIQSRVSSWPPKIAYNSNIFSEALTDADLSIQNLFELITLARFRDVSLFGEEIDNSLNNKYVPRDAEVQIILDPLNGTKMYRDMSGEFDISFAVLQDDCIVGGVIYIPSKRVCYLATGDGAYWTTAERIEEGAPWFKYQIKKKLNTVLTYRASDEDMMRLKGYSNDIIEIDKQYDSNKQNNAVHDVLTGKICACFRRNGFVGDWGVVGFVVKKAGGVFMDYYGDEINSVRGLIGLRLPSMIIAADHTIANQIRKVINAVK
jgi:fructose-1,6-bisphosphatase/inositol monophosphatase family enzyme